MNQKRRVQLHSLHISSKTISPKHQMMNEQASPKSIVSPFTQRFLNDDSNSQFDDLVKTPFDGNIMKLKHRSNANQHLRLEAIYKYVYEKKLQSKMKYSQSSRSNVQAQPVANGSISIMLNRQKKDNGFNMAQFKKKIPQKSKFKMKWKTIQWILLNRKDAINQLFQNYQKIISKMKEKKEGMNQEEFLQLLNSIQLGADYNLANKLFYVLDEDQSGTVDYKELIVGLEVLKDDTIEEKLKIFFDLCDLDGSGKISEKEIFNVLKSNIASENDKYQLRQSIREMIRQCDQNGDGELDKEELLQAAQNNIVLRRLLEQTIQNVKRIDTIIKNDLEEPFNSFTPASSYMQQKEGIHFPTQQKILNLLSEIEQIRTKANSFAAKRSTLHYNNNHGFQNTQQYQGLIEKKYSDDSELDIY